MSRLPAARRAVLVGNHIAAGAVPGLEGPGRDRGPDQGHGPAAAAGAGGGPGGAGNTGGTGTPAGTGGLIPGGATGTGSAGGGTLPWPAVTPGATTPPGGNPPPAPPVPKNTRFYGTVRLDPERFGRDLNRLYQEVIQHLAALEGTELQITVEIQAVRKDGYPDATTRIVAENARTLKFDESGFEDH